MDQVKVGGELDAYCTTCKIMKNHVVVAMLETKPAKVECLGCHKQHVYREGPPGTKKPRAASSKRSVEKTPPIADLDERLTARESDARGYSPQDRYTVDDVIRHPSFGSGLVVALPAAQKMEVAFRGGRKLLLHDRGGAIPLTLERPKPREENEPRPVTDAPPPK